MIPISPLAQTAKLGVAILLTFITLSLALSFVKRKFKRTGKYSYKAKALMTRNEQEMYWKLRETFPTCQIFSQVALTSLVDGKDFASFGTISKMSVDFVITDKNINVITAIEIDDRSHQRADRQRADAAKNEACRQAGIKLIRWKATPHPTQEQMRAEIAL
jgi:hypothetical protein